MAKAAVKKSVSRRRRVRSTFARLTSVVRLFNSGSDVGKGAESGDAHSHEAEGDEAANVARHARPSQSFWHGEEVQLIPREAKPLQQRDPRTGSVDQHGRDSGDEKS